MRDADARGDGLGGDAFRAVLAGEIDDRLDGFFAALFGRMTVAGFGGRAVDIGSSAHNFDSK